MTASQPERKEAALEGVRVIDFTHFIAGPLLHDDPGRSRRRCREDRKPCFGRRQHAGLPAAGRRRKRPVHLGQPQQAQRGDRSATPAGHKIALDLLSTADILVENFSTGIMERFGLAYETVSKLNERLIYCSISAYGRWKRPLKD